jgi:hypothetical protein
VSAARHGQTYGTYLYFSSEFFSVLCDILLEMVIRFSHACCNVATQEDARSRSRVSCFLSSCPDRYFIGPGKASSCRQPTGSSWWAVWGVDTADPGAGARGADAVADRIFPSW